MTGVILFRAQPFHNGHLHMVKTAFEDCIRNLDNDLHIFIGSADKCGTPRNPLPIDLREELVKGTIKDTFSVRDRKRIHIHRLDDLTDEADNSLEWGKYLYKKIIEQTKDESIMFYYTDTPQIMLSWFEGNESLQSLVSFKFLERYQGISATKVRKAILEGHYTLPQLLPEFTWSRFQEIKKYLEEAYKR